MRSSLSPDGTTVAFVAQRDAGETSQIYVRRLAELQATPLSGHRLRGHSVLLP